MEDERVMVDVAAGQIVRLLRAGNALAHAIGHEQGCPKIHASIPCTCGSASEQAGALNDWYQLVREYDKQS